MLKNWNFFTIIFFLFVQACSTEKSVDFGSDKNWSFYQGGPGANQYSKLNQINTDNVDRLEIAWVYRSGEYDENGRSQIQCNPLIINGVLYGTNPNLKLFALNAATGEELWVFDPQKGRDDFPGQGVNRGLVFWEGEEGNRILYTAGSYLYAVSLETGELFTNFGQDGRVDLHEGLDRDVKDLYIGSNTPGVIFKNLLILGTRVSESIGHVPGHIRAYDVRTGQQEWIFHTIPHPGEEGYETWPPNAYLYSGGANSWSGMSVDYERGIVYIPTGSPSFDFYGGDRIGANLFANCLLALDAATGEKVWHYQIVRHDLWDRDLPAPPNLLTINVKGEMRDVVAQITKSGYVFVFDRDDGTPIWPIEEIATIPSDLKGDEAYATQPLPSNPPPFSRQTYLEEDLPDRNPEARAFADSVWQISGKNHPFRPFATTPGILFPGFDGGGEWGGAAACPDGILYVNASQMPWVVFMEEFEIPDSKMLAARGHNIYRTSCLQCHGPDRQGGEMFGNTPSLIGLKDRSTHSVARKTIKEGKGVMPAFNTLDEESINALIAFLFESKEEISGDEEQQEIWNYPYTFGGYSRFTAPDGYPAISPPWGLLNAIDLNHGEILYQVTLGDLPEARKENDPPTGSENYGGPIVTAGDLIFIGATKDSLFRAFNRSNGEELWSDRLPVPAYATPATYMSNGRQYVVIAAGGGKIGSPSGDYYIAYSLSD